MANSICNQLRGTARKIIRGRIVTEVVVMTSAGDLPSVITTNSTENIKLKEGERPWR